MKCKSCGKTNARNKHIDGKYICNDCIGKYFVCPKCGQIFDKDDYERGDSGNGFCVSCAKEME